MGKIAVVRRDGLGDLLCAYPLINYLKQHSPDDTITLFVGSGNAPLLDYLPPVDEVVVLPNRGNKYLNLFRVARKFRGQFERVYIAKTSPMKLMNIFLGLLKPREGFAYVDQSWHARFVSRPQTMPPCKLHQAVRSLHMVAPHLKEVPEELYPRIESSHPPKPKLLLSASTTKEASRLPPARYAALASRLATKHALEIDIVTLPADRERAEEISRLLTLPARVVQPPSFDAFISLLKEAALFFVGDGGVGHLAAALDRPALVLFGQTDPVEWHPLSKKVHTVYHPDHVKCLDDDEVYQQLETICGTYL